jgi:hypothetical protein
MKSVPEVTLNGSRPARRIVWSVMVGSIKTVRRGGANGSERSESQDPVEPLPEVRTLFPDPVQTDPGGPYRAVADLLITRLEYFKPLRRRIDLYPAIVSFLTVGMVEVSVRAAED